MTGNHSRLLGQIQKDIIYGKQGLNKGLPFGIGPFDKHVCGVQRGRYDVVFGEEATGKTALVDQCYVLSPMDWLAKNPETPYRYTVLYYTLEIDPVKKLTKWGCWNHQRRTGAMHGLNEVLARGRSNTFNPKLAEAVMSAASEIDKRIVQPYGNMKLNFRTVHNPDQIISEVEDYALKKGTMVQDKRTKEVYFKPNNPFHLIQVIIDNAGNIDDGGSKKKAIDALSGKILKIRNRYGVSFCLVMHANRALSANDRGKSGEIFPKNADIKETHQPAQDAETVIALFNPFRHMNDKNTLGTFMNYPIHQMGNMFRAAGVLKNRDGGGDLRFGLGFCGPTGAFQALPPPEAFEQRPELITDLLEWRKFRPYDDIVDKTNKQLYSI